MAQSDIAETAALERMSAAQSESLCADLVAHWTLFKGAELGDPGHLDTMLDIMEKAAPDLKYGPHTQDEGIQRFFDFDEELSKDFAVKMMTELKVSRVPPVPLLLPLIFSTNHSCVLTSWLIRLSARASEISILPLL